MKKRNPTARAEVSHACYVACNRAGILRNGRPVRSGQRFRDERKERARRACRERCGAQPDA